MGSKPCSFASRSPASIQINGLVRTLADFYGLDVAVSETAARKGAVRRWEAHRLVERRGRDLNPRGACRRLAIFETAAHEGVGRPVHREVCLSPLASSPSPRIGVARNAVSPYLLRAPQRATQTGSVPKTCPQAGRSSDAVFPDAAFCRCFLIYAATRGSVIPSLFRRCSVIAIQATKIPVLRGF